MIVADNILHIIDFKYGQGSSQCRKITPNEACLRKLAQFDGIYDVDTVAMTIYQPRRENVSTATIPKDDYMSGQRKCKTKSKIAFKGDGNYCPGEWCKFCRAAVKCEARAEAKMKLAAFELPTSFTN